MLKHNSNRLILISYFTRTIVSSFFFSFQIIFVYQTPTPASAIFVNFIFLFKMYTKACGKVGQCVNQKMGK